MNTKAILAFAFLSGSYVYAAPPCHTLQCKPDELMEVEGKRLIPPGYLYVSEQSVEMKNLAGGGAGGGSTASPADVNNGGAKKAEKAKAEENIFGSNFFKGAWDSLRKLGQSASSWSFGFEFKFEHKTNGKGEESTNLDGCLEVARGTHNKTTCTKTDAVKRPDGKYFIEIKKLVAVQDIQKRWSLVYSTNDTISFLVDYPEEALNAFIAIDPTL